MDARGSVCLVCLFGISLYTYRTGDLFLVYYYFGSRHAFVLSSRPVLLAGSGKGRLRLQSRRSVCLSVCQSTLSLSVSQSRTGRSLASYSIPAPSPIFLFPPSPPLPPPPSPQPKAHLLRPSEEEVPCYGLASVLFLALCCSFTWLETPSGCCPFGALRSSQPLAPSTFVVRIFFGHPSFLPQHSFLASNLSAFFFFLFFSF